jgi:hypothetical protein
LGKQIPGGNDRKKRKSKGKGSSNRTGKYRGLSASHHERQERDAPVEMTGFWVVKLGGGQKQFPPLRRRSELSITKLWWFLCEFVLKCFLYGVG